MVIKDNKRLKSRPFVLGSHPSAARSQLRAYLNCKTLLVTLNGVSVAHNKLGLKLNVYRGGLLSVRGGGVTVAMSRTSLPYIINIVDDLKQHTK